MKLTWKNRVVEIIQGDITEQNTEALVNAANNHLWMGAGVAGAIKRKGGAAIEAEAVKKGPIPVGEAVVTSAGSLKAKYIIHAAVMGQDLTTDKNKIKTATLNALKRADELRIENLSFPALGTGVGGFPMREAARTMMEAARFHLENNPGSLKIICFILFQEEARKDFEKEATSIFKE